MENPFLRGTHICSIFGQIEEVAADIMLRRHPEIVRRIEVSEFPPAKLCPDIHLNEQGQHAKFALIMPKQCENEFNDIIADLYA